MVEPDVSPAQLAWDRQDVWSQAADRLKKALFRARALALALTVAAAVLALLASQLTAVSLGAARGLAFAAAVAVGVTPIVRAATAADRVGSWIHARALAETLKAEVFLYLTRAGRYDCVQADVLLDDEVDRLEREAGSLDSRTAGIVPGDARVPQVHDLAGYLAVRIRPEIDGYYRRQAEVQRWRLQVARRVETGLALLAAALAAAAATYDKAGLAAWVSVVTTVSAAVVAHAASQRYALLQIEYTHTADVLEGMLHRRGRLTGPSGAPLTDKEFVVQCERVIAVQNDTWMAKVGARSQTSETGE